MKNLHYILTALIFFSINLSAQAAVTATISKNTIASGDTLQLRLQRDGSADGQPDISPLRKDFDVLGSSSGSNVQIINGKMSTQTQITILLSPKHDGKILIPPLQWGNEQSTAIELTVGGGVTTPSDTQADNDANHIYLTTTLDKIQPYVQAAVVLTLRLYADQALHQAALDFPASNDVLIKQLGKDVQLSETRNGRNYMVIERKYLLFPQRSGKLKLDGPVLNAHVVDRNGNDPFDNLFRQIPFGGMLNQTRPIRVHAKPIELTVLPRPASMSGANWLPAQKVTLEETSLQNKTTMHVGEPLTRHVKITALGLTGTQLPDPSSLMNVPEGIKAYPDQATLADNPQGNSVLGSREQNIALIASRPGRYELPAVRLSWWDTIQNQKREISLPAHSVDVLPGASGAPTVAMPPANMDPSISLDQPAPGSIAGQTNKFGNNPLWMWLSLAFSLLWLSTSVAWWRARQRIPQTLQVKVSAEKKPIALAESAEIKAIKRACNNNNAHEARQHLLAWAVKYWPESPPLGLNELARRLDDAAFVETIRQLDRTCYTGSTWRGDSLAQSLPATLLQEITSRKDSRSLPALYQ